MLTIITNRKAKVLILKEKIMLINKDKIKISVTEVISFLIGLLFVIGINTWFSACKGHDGIMSCSYAGRTVTALSALIFSLIIIKAFIPDGKIKAGIDIAVLGIAIIALAVPNGIIDLCAMNAMQCRKSMQPWTVVFSVLVMIISVIDGWFYLIKAKKGKR